MQRIVAIVAMGALFLAACSADEPGGEQSTTSVREDAGPRFCDAFLDYIGDRSAPNLLVVTGATDDDSLLTAAANARGNDPAAIRTLDELARERCQPEWTGGAQGAGTTEGAAQAMIDALIAGDRIGAGNIASRNAIAIFEPWLPAAGNEPTLVSVDGQSFTLALADGAQILCQVETGVAVACDRQ